MKISLNIILDRLSELGVESYIDAALHPGFSGAELLPSDPDSKYRADRLYICRLSEALCIPAERRRGATVLCLRDSAAESAQTQPDMEGIVTVGGELGFEQLFSRVQDIFSRINGWYIEAQEAIIKNRPLQDIIDLSEEVLENYVQITDSSFALLGYTRHIECDDEITLQARHHGFHPESTVKLFERYRRMDTWGKTAGILTNDSGEISRYSLISRVFKYSNTYFAHAVMTCNNRQNTKGMQELFELFTDLIAVYVEKAWDEASCCHHTYDPFLHDLYEGNITRRDIAEERSRHMGIPLDGTYCIAVTSMNESGRVPLGSIVQDISAARPRDKVTNLHGCLAVLCQLADSGLQAQLDAFRLDMEKVMEKYDIRCGISAVFRDLFDAPQALTQAKQALSYSGRTPGAELLAAVDKAPNGLQCRAVSFEDSFIYILLGGNPSGKAVWHCSAYYAALRSLYDYDCQHNINNLHLLYTYLLCESRPTDTANIMFMSRNNVVYRIERIQDMLQMDLRSPSVRCRLLMSYMMMQLYGLD